MSKKEADILLIGKYLKGELDARAMHLLERRALDDPFLMDALEGYEKAGTDQQANLDEISNLLKQRVDKKERRIIPWRIAGIAASVLITASVGGLLLFNNSQSYKKKSVVVAENVILSQPAVEEKAAAPDTIQKIATVLQSLAGLKPGTKKRKEAAIVKYDTAIVEAAASADAKVAAPATNAADTTPVNEIIVMNYAPKQKKDANGQLAAGSTDKVKRNVLDSSRRLLQGSVPGVTVNPFENPSQYSNNFLRSTITGQVVDKNDGLPLIGATVKVKGTNIAAVTDVNGKFSLPFAKTETTLVAGYIGYETAEISTRSRDSVKTIKLGSNHSALNEVVVVGYGARKDGYDAAIIDAHPEEGWSSFKKDIEAKAVSPDGALGVVKLSFNVDSNGNISEVTVIKSLSKEADKKAIELINNGPTWVGNTNGKTEQVKVRVRFSKK